tara:strand:+ start:261 stop:461 length:201 start_codon:yes stop_codon:yes gene_type:complete
MLQTPLQAKEDLRQEIAQHVKVFLDKGQEITQLDVGASSERPPKHGDFTINGKGSSGVRKKPSLAK